MTKDLISFKKLISKKDWCFFDFFGTIINRRCTADEIKIFWARKLGRILQLDDTVIYRTRKAAEHVLQSHGHDSEFTYEELCEEIFSRLCSLNEYCNENWDIAKFSNLAYNVELEVESSMQYVIQDVCYLLQQAKKDFKKTAIISDFYLPKKAITHFLKIHNLDEYVDEIFVSCEYKASKRSGLLYNVVIRNLETSSNKCLMIGNDRKSDYSQAQASGIDALHRKSEEKSSKLSIGRELHILANKHRNGILRYSNYAFLLYRFIENLADYCLKSNQTHVYFLAREGQVLKRLFDLYVETHFPGNFESQYLYVSRKSTYPLTLRKLSDERFETLRKFKSLSLTDFLSNIGLDSKFSLNFATKVNKIARIEFFFESQIFADLCKQKDFIRIYEENRESTKALFIKYLSEHGIKKDNRVLLVDVGWNGTIQNHLSNIVDVTDGCYIGLLPSHKSQINKNSTKRGLIFSTFPFVSEDFDIWSADYTFLERLLSANHGATEGYICCNGDVRPVLKEYNSESGSYRIIKPVQETLVEKFKEIALLFKDTTYTANDFYDFFKAVHLSTVYCVNVSQVKLQHSLLSNQMQNFGTLRSAGEEISVTYSARNRFRELLLKIRKVFNVTLIRNFLIAHKMHMLCALYLRIVYLIKYSRLKKS